MKENNIFCKQLKNLKNSKFGRFYPSKYFESHVNSKEINSFNWENFKERIKPLKTIKFLNSELECLITPKNIAWGVQDVNVYIGGNDRQINEIIDLDEKEGKGFFELNFYLARNILNKEMAESHISIGFNPEDFSPGHHSVKRLHSHVYIADSFELRKRVEDVDWKSLNKNEKLSFIEPFSDLYYEYADYLIKNDEDFKCFDVELKNENGFISFYFKESIKAEDVFIFLKKFYDKAKKEYEIILDLFSDKKTDKKTNRFKARNSKEASFLVDIYLKSKPNIFSEDSRELMKSLAKKITNAKIKEKSSLNTNEPMEDMWITKGFAGAITIVFKYENEGIRIDFLPRVISSSTVDRTIFSMEKPIKIKRGFKDADEKGQKLMEDFHLKICKLTDDFTRSNK